MSVSRLPLTESERQRILCQVHQLVERSHTENLSRPVTQFVHGNQACVETELHVAPGPAGYMSRELPAVGLECGCHADLSLLVS